MQIYPITSNYMYNSNLRQKNLRNNNQTFTGMTNVTKKQVCIDGKKDLLAMLNERAPEQTSYVGQLPPGIFYSLPANKAERTKAIAEFLNAMDESAKEIRSFVPGVKNTREEVRNRRPDETVERLSKLFEKYDLIEPGKEFNLLFLGRGDYGSAFKLDGLKKDSKTNDDYIIKVFTVNDKGPEWHRYKSHGNYSEINTANYWISNIGSNTQRGKFYVGNIEHGWMMDNYIDDNVPQPEIFYNEYDNGLKLTDEQLKMPNGHNKINNYSIDWGGVRVVNRIKNSNKTARYVLKKIKMAEDDKQIEWYRIYNNRKLDKDGKMAGLALSIKYMEQPDEYLDLCLREDKPIVDVALSYVLKYLPLLKSKSLFTELMQRNDPTTQIVLMNEIPLLARNQRIAKKIDDLDIPRDEINPKKIAMYYDIADKYALPESREHLASYIHLLPEDRIMPAFDELLETHNPAVYDRLMHKMRIVQDDEYPLDLKYAMLDKLEKVVEGDFLKKKVHDTRVLLIRRNLDDTE